MEREARANEGGSGVRETRGVGITRGARCGGVTTKGMKRGFNAEAALATASLGGCFFGGGESEGSEWGQEGGVVGSPGVGAG